MKKAQSESAMKKAQSELATILVVSGDEAICNVIQQALERGGYRVLEVRDAKTALEICRQPMELIDLVLTEATMPQFSGRALIDSAARLRPRTKVIYMSRNVDLLLSQGVLTPDMAYLRKPFTGVEVLAKVQEVLRPSQSGRQIACPRCSSLNTKRSQRRWMDWLPPLILSVPYRCRDC